MINSTNIVTALSWLLVLFVTVKADCMVSFLDVVTFNDGHIRQVCELRSKRVPTSHVADATCSVHCLCHFRTLICCDGSKSACKMIDDNCPAVVFSFKSASRQPRVYCTQASTRYTEADTAAPPIPVRPVADPSEPSSIHKSNNIGVTVPPPANIEPPSIPKRSIPKPAELPRKSMIVTVPPPQPQNPVNLPLEIQSRTKAIPNPSQNNHPKSLRAKVRPGASITNRNKGSNVKGRLRIAKRYRGRRLIDIARRNERLRRTKERLAAEAQRKEGMKRMRMYKKLNRLEEIKALNEKKKQTFLHSAEKALLDARERKRKKQLERQRKRELRRKARRQRLQRLAARRAAKLAAREKERRAQLKRSRRLKLRKLNKQRFLKLRKYMEMTRNQG